MAAPSAVCGPTAPIKARAIKTVPIREEFKFQFRVETFNIWNHANFDAVNTSLGSPNFGQVTRAMEPRILEFGLRLTF